MKLKSLVIADHKAAVNEKSGFAHTAHHAREILTARSLSRFPLNHDFGTLAGGLGCFPLHDGR